MQREVNFNYKCIMLSHNVKLLKSWMEKMNEGNNQANLNEGIREFFPRGNEVENFMKTPLVTVRGLRGRLG